MSQSDHKAAAPAAIACFVLTVSDTRTPDTDTSGGAIRALLEAAGHHVTGSAIVADDPATVRDIVRNEATAGTAQVVIITGGTGLTSRDSSYEAIAGLLDKQLDGFGELFRMLSYHEIGPAAMLSRATAGAIGRTAVFLLPGSEHAVRLGMDKLVIPELGHVAQQLRK